MFKFIPPVPFLWLRDGCLNQKSFCFYAKNVGTGQCSALLYSHCFSSHLSLFFGIYTLFSSYCLTRLSFRTLCLLLTPTLCFLPMLFCLPLIFLFLFFSLFLVSALYLDSCIFLHTSLDVTPFPPLCPFVPPPSHHLPLSVPAGGRSPLCAATAAQGQLLARGDEAG